MANDYRTQAQARAKRRLSPWNVALALTIFLWFAVLWLGLLSSVQFLHGELHPGETLDNGNGAGPALAAVGSTFAAIPLAMLAGNWVMRLVPPARKALDGEAERHPGTDYQQSQAQLRRIARLVVPLGLFVAGMGSVIGW